MREDIRYLTMESSLPFGVEMAGISYCDETYHVFRRHASIAVFEYILSGTGTVCEDQQTCHPAAGDVYILHPNCRHEYFADPDDPWTKIWFNIRGPVVDALLQAYQVQHVNLVRNCPEAIAGLFSRFLQETQADQPLPVIFDRCALVFHQLVSALAQQAKRNGPDPDEAECLKTYIQAHLAEPLSLADLSRQIYRSPAYTIRVFREAFHQTPCAYLANCRIEAARQMLAGTQLPIQSIASRLCFADQHYFATVFRQATGQTPRQYRQRNMNEPPAPNAGR